MALDIIAVQTKKDWNAFIRFPYQHYKNHPQWVPPLLMDQKVLLNPKKYPFWDHADHQFFLAKRDGSCVGRIAAIVDHRHNKVHDEKMGFFGFFETVNDQEVADGLLGTAKDWVKQQGMNRLRGPANPCQNEDCGLLIDAFDLPPVLMMTYNYDYYQNLIESFGLKKAMDLWAYYIDATHIDPPEKMIRVVEKRMARKSVVIRPINKKDFWAEAKKVWMIYNKAWEKNWGFVPMTEAEFDHLAKHLKSVVVPELGLMAEIQGEPVGFSLTLPDLNQALIHTNGRLFPTGLFKILKYEKKIDMARVIIMGVIPEHRNLGIDSMFYLETWRNAKALGYTRGEMSWILENNNQMNRALQMLGAEVYKTYRMYEMPV